jgi:hypothetical protein
LRIRFLDSLTSDYGVGDCNFFSAQIFRFLDAPISTDKYAFVSEEAQRKYRQQRVVPKVIIAVSQHKWMQADFGHIQFLRAAEHMGVQVTDTRLLELHGAPLDLDTAVNQGCGAIEFVARYGDGQAFRFVLVLGRSPAS